MLPTNRQRAGPFLLSWLWRRKCVKDRVAMNSWFSRRAFVNALAVGAAAGPALVRGAVAKAAAPAPVFAGPSFFPHDAEYEAKRTSLVWQDIKPAARPAAIFEARSPEDVVTLVRKARDDRRRVTIVSGGHSYVGNALHDGVQVICLGQMNDVAIDVAGKRASLQAGVRAFDFDAALEADKLAFPVAHNPTVGLAGYLLGGGMGWNAESWGSLACFNLTALDVVLASGETVHADATSHPDLLWAARGGGPNFPGVVTRFHVNVFDRPAAIRQSTYIYTADALEPLLAWMEKARAQLSPKADLWLVFVKAQETKGKGPFVLQLMVLVTIFADDDGEAQAIHKATMAGAPTGGVVSSEELAKRTVGDLLLGDQAGAAVRHSVQTMWTDDAHTTAVNVAKAMESVPAQDTIAVINYRSRPTLPGSAAYSRIGKAFLYLDTMWERPSDDAANQQWADGVIAGLKSVDAGAYINETEYRRNPARLSNCYAPEALERLRSIVTRYDPDKLFVSPLNP
jgi:FAD/FMN-containing dehydrogenase